MPEHTDFPKSGRIPALERAPQRERSEVIDRVFSDGMLEQVARCERSEIIGRAIGDGIRELGALAASVFTALAQKLRRMDRPRRHSTE